MIKYILPAAVATLLMCSSASAAPAGSAAGLTHIDTKGVTEAQAHRKGDARPRRHTKRRYVPGRRYRTAPRGYRRYTTRPYDWRTRGCVIVGPLWFCP